MRIVSARIRNAFCFRGEHVLNLDPKVYAVVASYEGEEGASNWGGKSSLLRCLGSLPLFGWHGKRLEDDWICEGEDEAEVELRFDDGSRVLRSRRRGRSTQVEIETAGSLVGQKGAAEAIEDLLRLDENDFFATRFLRQKQVDRLLTAKPAERHELVVGWFDLGGLQECENAVRQDLSEANRKLLELERQEAAAVETIEQMRSTLDVGAKVDKEVAKLRRQAKAARSEVEKLRELSSRGEKIRAAQRAEAELRRIADRGKALAAEIKTRNPNVEEAEKTATAARDKVRSTEEEVSRLRVLARGEFDGVCPVAKGLTCPAKASINAEGAKHRAALEAAQEPAEAARRALAKARAALDSEREKDRSLAAAKGELESLTRRWKELKPEAAGADDPLPEGDPDAEARAWLSEAADAEARAGQLERAAEKIGEAETRLVAVREKLAELRERRDRLAEAVAVFGRQGAQRRCSEAYLSKIETSANDLLASSGLDLRVRASWGREGQGLARTCERCGDAFPTSAKIKQCGRCGAPRGANVVERLDLDVNVSSDGGAADLGGMALQLAAGAWLQARRGSPFSVAYLDEPFASIDAAKRASVARSLVGMLTGRYGLEQSFIVAHTSDALDACPGRIEIVVDREGRRSIQVA